MNSKNQKLKNTKTYARAVPGQKKIKTSSIVSGNSNNNNNVQQSSTSSSLSRPSDASSVGNNAGNNEKISNKMTISSGVKIKKNLMLTTAKIASANQRKTPFGVNVTRGKDTSLEMDPSKQLGDNRNYGDIPFDPTKKLERSNSFFLTRKISKIFHSLTGSRESLHNLKPSSSMKTLASEESLTPNHRDHAAVVDDECPYKFTRSRSMILLRRPNRRSVIKPQLERLTEEAERSEKTKTSPTALSPISAKEEELFPSLPFKTNSTLNLQTLQQSSNDEVTPMDTKEFLNKKNSQNFLRRSSKNFRKSKKESKKTRLSQEIDEHNDVLLPSSMPTVNSRKSSLSKSAIISTLKRTFHSSSDKSKFTNPRWSASLQSLQEIDNFVSYEDLSFIDYDKFNDYEKFLEQNLSQNNLINEDRNILSNSRTSFIEYDGDGGDGDNENYNIKLRCRQKSKSISTTPNSVIFPKNIKTVPSGSTTSLTASLTGLGTKLNLQTSQVVKRRKKSSQGSSEKSDRNSLNFDSSIEQSNFDKQMNLYRQSLDSEKLKFLNDIQRDSFVWSENEIPIDFNRNSGRQCPFRSKSDDVLFLRSSFLPQGDVVDGVLQQDKLKSKSLTHLDTLDSLIACHQDGMSEHQTVSSSEYFSVQFCIENGVQDEEFIPATKGITLSEALGDILKKRKLTFSQINISDNNFHNFFESGSPPYLSSLDECTDVENLAGKVLVITEKEGLKKTNTLQKAASFGSRTRPPRLLSSASTEETIDSDQKAIPGKQLKQRWSGLFGIKNPQQSQLCELLNNYAKNGVPQKMSSLNFDHPDFEAALEYLDKIHKSWKDFIRYDEMGENEMKVQTAIWELVTTEVDYIHALQTVTDLFLACLEAIQEEKLLTDIDQNKLFSNIRDICAANLKFWALYLYPMVANSIVNNNPMCIDYFQPGFVTFATTFAPYKKYCAEQSTCQFYCKELNRNNALFTAYLAWCESQKMCNRLRLADILVRPMQRLTKYSLLLAAIRKHIIDENDADIMDSMIHSVENFVCSVNTHLTTRQENERLKGIMARIESYDIVDLNNEHLEKLVKQYCTILDLCSPMKGCASNQGRHLFMEGDLKLKDNQGKLDVHCFLLTDILLICKTIAKKGQGTLKVIRQPYLTDRLIVKHKDNTLYCIYLNEFQMAISAFTLQCAEAKSWNDSITKAKHIYSRLKQGSHWDGYTLRTNNNNNVNNNNISNCINNSGQNSVETLGVKKSPLNSSIGSRVSSLNNSHSGSVELNDSRNISVDFEKTNSLSSDEGSMISTNNSVPQKPKTLAASPHKQLKVSTSNTLVVQPLNSLGQSLPNLNLHQSQSSNNTLLVPGVSSHSGNVLLSPSHRGISYPPPSPTRATLRRGFAFSSSIKNPPLVKTRNITSQSSINWPQQSPTTGPIAGSCLINSQQQQQQQSISSQQQQRQQSSPVPMGKDSLKINNESDV